LFYSKLLSHETKIKKNKFQNQEAFETYANDELSENYKTYFCYDASKKTVVRNEAKINEYLSKSGFFIIISNKKDLEKQDVLSFYRNKDKVEKIFDNTKNELNTNRLHSHSKTATDGRLFVKFIATILYQQITKVMKENDMFKKYSVTEMLKELSKMKMISLPKLDDFISECSKKQNEIFDKFKINLTT
jgi:transposase